MVSPIYMELVSAIDCVRRRRGFSMANLDDKAGTPDGYFAKALHADTPSGRQGRLETLDLFAQALAPKGYRIVIEPVDLVGRPTYKSREPDQLRLPLDAPEMTLTDVRRAGADARKRRPPKKYRRKES